MPKLSDYGKFRTDFNAALTRFAETVPLVARSGAAQAEVATRAVKVRRTMALVLDCADGEGLAPDDMATLDYVTARLGAMLDVADVAASLTAAGDTAFDERAFADNIAGLDLADLHGVARLVSLDTGGLGRCGIARGFEALSGVSAGVGPGLAQISKALIIIGAFLLVLRGKMSTRRFRFLVEELFAIDKLLAPGGDGLDIAAAGALLPIDILEHCTPRPFEVKAGDLARFRYDAEDPPSNGIIEIDGGKGGGKKTIRFRETSDAIIGPATVTLHYKSGASQPAGHRAGVTVIRRRIF